ncbi:hypothetical protein Xmir_03896 [Xenorhabdus miraniensis]|uniref:Uncharacterized protein n=1 Tax=Xenorhabdus miraniensis TaxID=351674 RepID=A0A2D0JKG5_9GAMM|nr:hypothetical protein Xmir_03896 [Xenorhabdus miraniensis]
MPPFSSCLVGHQASYQYSALGVKLNVKLSSPMRFSVLMLLHMYIISLYINILD